MHEAELYPREGDMLEKKAALIIDLDGTLCDTRHRQHHMQGEKKDWDAFYAGIPDDPINDWCADLIYQCSDLDSMILFVSGRPEKYRSVSKEWLKEKMPWSPGISRLFMRKDGDFRKDAIVKTEIYHQEIEPYFSVKFCIDDRKQVVDAWRALGLVCLQCAEGDF